MKILESGIYRSSDYFNSEISPERIVERYELELYFGGEGFSVINGIKYPHAGCHFLLSKPNERRFSIGRFECSYVHFISDEPELENIAGYIRKDPEDASVSAMERIMSGSRLKRLSCLCELLDELSSYKERPKNSERYIEQIIMTKEYMEKNYGSRITLEDLSELTYLSKNFYRTIFSRVMEMSPQKYLQKIRVSKAVELIRKGDIPLSEIAQICGFENQSYMNYVIKNATGKTPTEFKE